MNPKILAFFDEFPFLKRSFDPRLFRSTRVLRVDEYLLVQTWRENYGITRVEFFDAEGELLGSFEEKNRFRDIFSNDSATLTYGALLATLGEKEPCYVVHANGPRRNRSWDLIVYKPPKGFTIRKWLDELYRRGQEEVKAAVKEIDEEAEAA